MIGPRFGFNAFNSNLMLLSPEKFRYIIANDRVKREVMIEGRIIKNSFNRFSYHLIINENREFLVMDPYKSLFGYKMYTYGASFKPIKLGHIKFNGRKDSFVFYEDELDKLLIKYRNVVYDQKRLRNIEITYAKEGDSILRIHKKKLGFIKIVNKRPFYNKERELYTLNYDNTLVVPSEKNLQLIHPQLPDHINLSFGKSSEKCFEINHSFPWNGAQAFAIGITALTFKD